MILKDWKRYVDALKRDTFALFLASKHPKTPCVAKLVIVATVAYAVSPIDLIPDFIPVLGYLDDLLILPAGIWLAIRLVPENVWIDCQARAAQEMVKLSPSRGAAVVIVLVWLLAFVWFTSWMSGLLWSG